MHLRSAVATALLGVGLLTARVFWTHEGAFVFLVWNLFLAWLPLAFAVVAYAAHHHRAPSALVALLFVPWLAFLPNAPYLVSDLVHLTDPHRVPVWYDALMLSSFAWSGVSAGVLSLRVATTVTRERAGAGAARGVVLGSCALVGYGIYLGRFARLNSWDVVTRPGAVLATIGRSVTTVHLLSPAFTVTVGFAAFFLAAYGIAPHDPPRAQRSTAS